LRILINRKLREQLCTFSLMCTIDVNKSNNAKYKGRFKSVQ